MLRLRLEVRLRVGTPFAGHFQIHSPDSCRREAAIRARDAIVLRNRERFRAILLLAAALVMSACADLTPDRGPSGRPVAARSQGVQCAAILHLTRPIAVLRTARIIEPHSGKNDLLFGEEEREDAEARYEPRLASQWSGRDRKPVTRRANARRIHLTLHPLRC